LRIIEFKLEKEKNVIAKIYYRQENPEDFTRTFIKYIYDNLEKPIVMPTETYVQNSLL
jgi:hypothetical protein